MSMGESITGDSSSTQGDESIIEIYDIVYVLNMIG